MPHSEVFGVVHRSVRSTIRQSDSHETTPLRDNVHVDDVRRATRVIWHHHARYVVVLTHRTTETAIVHNAATAMTASAIMIFAALSNATRALRATFSAERPIPSIVCALLNGLRMR